MTRGGWNVSHETRGGWKQEMKQYDQGRMECFTGDETI